MAWGTAVGVIALTTVMGGLAAFGFGGDCAGSHLDGKGDSVRMSLDDLSQKK